jgi:hypothetical protein
VNGNHSRHGIIVKVCVVAVFVGVIKMNVFSALVHDTNIKIVWKISDCPVSSARTLG